MSDINFPIKRCNLYGAYVYLLDKKLNILKKKIAIYHSEEYLPYSHAFQDVFYETPQYKIIANMDARHNYFPIKPENRRPLSIVISKPLMLENLLYYADYNKNLSRKDLIDIKENIFNGKFAYHRSILFGYKRKPNEIIKNGVVVPNSSINHSTNYSMDNYELAEEPLIQQDIFEFLNEVDFNDPNAIFMPFTEEGEVRKRSI